jgi:hypothetical protein
MAEALACGTPVIALSHGSVPEVIEDGVTGFICSNEEELVAAVGRLDELDRARCRAEAERRFSPAAMGAAYERLYERLHPRSAHTTRSVMQLDDHPSLRRRPAPERIGMHPTSKVAVGARRAL